MSDGACRAEAHAYECKRERRLVRKKGLEPSRYCYRQPLKLVRLPIPPLPRGGYFFGCCAGACTGAGAVCPFTPLISDPAPRDPTTPSMIAPSMNSAPSTVVARVSTVAPARAPNAVWLLPPPPNALAM